MGPLTVFVWWGSWSFLNSYLFPERMEISGFVCAAIGNCGLLTLAFTQSLWKRYLPVDRTLHWVFGYHLYTVLCVFCNVCHWRGMWTILDHYTGVNLFSSWITYAIGSYKPERNYSIRGHNKVVRCTFISIVSSYRHVPSINFHINFSCDCVPSVNFHIYLKRSPAIVYPISFIFISHSHTLPINCYKIHLTSY